jgi:hypothetical protein
MTSMGRDSMTTRAPAMSVPTSMVPVVSTVTWAMTGIWRRRAWGGPVGGDRGALDLQDVLAGLDQDAVDAAVDEAADLLLVVGEQVVEGDVAERDEAGGRADRAEHEARALGGRELARRPPLARAAAVRLRV